MKVRASVKPICEKCKVIRRGGAVLVICPKVAPRNVPLGFWKCGVLVMLKISTRNSPLTFANENSFASVASRFT